MHYGRKDVFLSCMSSTHSDRSRREMFIQLNIQAILNTLNKDVFKLQKKKGSEAMVLNYI